MRARFIVRGRRLRKRIAIAAGRLALGLALARQSLVRAICGRWPSEYCRTCAQATVPQCSDRDQHSSGGEIVESHSLLESCPSGGLDITRKSAAACSCRRYSSCGPEGPRRGAAYTEAARRLSACVGAMVACPIVLLPHLGSLEPPLVGVLTFRRSRPPLIDLPHRARVGGPAFVQARIVGVALALSASAPQAWPVLMRRRTLEYHIISYCTQAYDPI